VGAGIRQRGITRVVGQLVHESDAQRLLGVNRPTAEAQVLGAALAHPCGEDHRRDRSEDAQDDLRLAELGIRRGEDAVAETNQLEGTAETLAPHRRKGHDLGIEHSVKQTVEPPQHSLELSRQVFLHVGTEGKVRPLALDQDRFEPALFARPPEQRGEQLGLLDVENVGLRRGETDAPDLSALQLFDRYRAIVRVRCACRHRRSPKSSSS